MPGNARHNRLLAALNEMHAAIGELTLADIETLAEDAATEQDSMLTHLRSCRDYGLMVGAALTEQARKSSGGGPP